MRWYVLRANVNREDRYIACKEKDLEALPEFWELCGPVFSSANEAQAYINSLSKETRQEPQAPSSRAQANPDHEKLIAQVLARPPSPAWTERDQDEFETRFHYAVQQRSHGPLSRHPDSPAKEGPSDAPGRED